MAKYTTQVRNICEQKAGLEESKGFNDVDSIIDNSWDKIFTTHCTFFDEQYRSVICKKILKHYYTREIGLETVGLWQLFMNRKLEEIMPYYNKLYESELIQFDPMHNMNLTKSKTSTGEEAGNVGVTGNNSFNESVTDSRDTTESENRSKNTTQAEDITVNGTGSTENSTTTTSSESGSSNRDIDRVRDNDVIITGASRDAYSDTPQGGISNVEDNSYLTNFRKIMDNKSDVTDEHEVTNDDVSTSATGRYTDTATGSESSRTTTDKDITGSETQTKQNIINESGNKNKMNSGTNNSTTTSTLSTTESYIETVVGNNGSWNFSRLLQDFRDTFLNIDMLVINEFKGMFMGLW